MVTPVLSIYLLSWQKCGHTPTHPVAGRALCSWLLTCRGVGHSFQRVHCGWRWCGGADWRKRMYDYNKQETPIMILITTHQYFIIIMSSYSLINIWTLHIVNIVVASSEVSLSQTNTYHQSGPLRSVRKTKQQIWIKHIPNALALLPLSCSASVL